IHEHEALGGGSVRRLYCRLTSFSRSLQIILRINLDGTKRWCAAVWTGVALKQPKLMFFLPDTKVR
ncbi:hypothetical protein ACTQ4E_13020, partial [Lawsonibacter sp. LCP25S3_G6]|uniref:hypothetical protein n=1 Tax=unclassified Lawsonibacter TaxID=2617946 RepID=UPI003F94958F